MSHSRKYSEAKLKRDWTRATNALCVTEAIVRKIQEKHITTQSLARKVGKSYKHIKGMLENAEHYTLNDISDVFAALDCTFDLQLEELSIPEGLRSLCEPTDSKNSPTT